MTVQPLKSMSDVYLVYFRVASTNLRGEKVKDY